MQSVMTVELRNVAVGKLLGIFQLLTARLWSCILGLGFCNVLFCFLYHICIYLSIYIYALSPSDVLFTCIWFHTPSYCRISSWCKGLLFTKVLLYPLSPSLKIRAYILIFGKNVFNHETLRKDTVCQITLQGNSIGTVMIFVEK